MKFIFLFDCNWDLNLDAQENKGSMWLVHTFLNGTALAQSMACLDTKLKSVWGLATPAFGEWEGPLVINFS